MRTHRLTRIALAATAAGAILASALGAPLAARPQEASARPPTPTFEVASVKRTPTTASGAVSVRLGGLQGNRWAAEGTTLFMLIRSAWGQQYAMQGQIVGGPDWIQTDRFNVTAVADGTPSQADVQLMLQHLLAERFKLVVHQEKRELPVYVLTLARSDGKLGRELKPAGVDCEELMAARKRGDAPPPLPFNPDDDPPPCSMMMMMGQQGMMRIRSGGTTIAQLAQTLSSPSGRPVLDRTGLSGTFAYSVEFAREPGSMGPFGGPMIVGPLEPPGAGGASTASDLPSIFAAVQEQLGLKLEPRREQADVLVIDRAEQPTED